MTSRHQIFSKKERTTSHKYFSQNFPINSSSLYNPINNYKTEERAMSSPFKTLFHFLCTGWLIEYPGRHIDRPPDFFAHADPARTHPVTKKMRARMDNDHREKEKW